MRRFIFTFQDGQKKQARHLIELYPGENWTTIVAIDQSIENECSSVTNSIEQLITELVDKEGLNPERIIVLEHYADLGTYDIVKFGERTDGRFKAPEWRTITEAEARQWCGEANVQQDEEAAGRAS